MYYDSLICQLFLLQFSLFKAQARKAELKRLPEKAILAEVRCMVEEMQGLNRRLEETVSTFLNYSEILILYPLIKRIAF